MLLKKRAYAKINLGLEILNKRPDKYHDINTIFHRVNLYDDLTFESLEEDSIKIESNIPELESEDNLIFKAAFKLKEKANYQKGVRIILKKNIPMGAGLGGGSSDAAETLKTLPELWDLDFNESRQKIIAMSLGSDIPYFLKEGTAMGRGRGEKLRYFDYTPEYKIVLINPNIHISTADAYKYLNRDNKPKRATNFYEIIKRSEQNPSLLKMLKNDFEPYVFKNYPLIKEIRDKLYDYGAYLSMLSGSGSTVFALFDDVNQDQIKNEFENYNVVIC